MDLPQSQQWLDMHMACEECDTIVELPTLSEGQQALCPRCGFAMMALAKNGFDRPLAYAIAAFFLMMVANAYTFLTFKSGGLGNHISLHETAIALYEFDSPELSVIVIVLIIVIPILLALLVIYLLAALKLQKPAPCMKPIAKFLFTLKSWNMADVFLISVVVSLVKLMSMATILLGPSFFGYIAFSLCLTGALGNLDKVTIWNAIERCST